MLFYFSKLAQPLLWPFNQMLILMAVALVLLWRGNLRAGRWVLTLTFVGVWIVSTPWVSIQFYEDLEAKYPGRPYNEYPTADAIVVLGGTMSNLAPPRANIEESHGSRVIPAYQLLRLNKAPVLILSSGSWYVMPDKQRRVEAEDMFEFLVSLGAPPKALIVEGKSRTTYENAQQSAKILRSQNRKKILLVTSAFHMERAVQFFEAEGLQVVPVPTDHKLTTERRITFRDFIPDGDGMGRMTSTIKEWIGSLVYSLVIRWR